MQLIRPVRLDRDPWRGWRCRRRERLLSPPERVFDALVDAGQLARWWCDEIDIAPRAGGVYSCRGRSHFAVEDEGVAMDDEDDSAADGVRDGEILEFEAPHVLAYRWRIGHVDTIVRFELESALEQTDLTITQTAASSPAWDRAATEPNWWSIALANLRAHVDADTPRLRLDYEQLRSGAVMRFEVSVMTFPWVIWSKLTDRNELSRWWGDSPGVTIDIGRGVDGEFRLADTPPGPTRVLAVEPGARFLHDFVWDESSTSRVEWRIEEGEDATRIEVSDDSRPTAPHERLRRGIYWANTLLDLARFSTRGVSGREFQDPW